MSLDRRHFLRLASTVFLTAGLPVPARARDSGARVVNFPQGVASADPAPGSILLWTRAEPASAGDVDLVLQIAATATFDQVVLEEAVSARQQDDYTVRISVDGLESLSHYYYRFLAVEGGSSRTGRTCTAPAPGSSEPLNLAFAACQNYEQGFYGAWRRMINDDLALPPKEQIHCVMQLGDFVYERYRNAAKDGQTFARALPAFPDGARSENGDRVWATSLADYRHLYKVYLADPHLQAARARWPFIVTWDDHEFSNDSYQDFNTYEEPHVREPQRKADASQAWSEFIPARVERQRKLEIYRSLSWGDTAELLLTDLRSYRDAPRLPEGFSKQLGLPLDPVELVAMVDAGRTWNNGEPPSQLPWGDGKQPNPAVDAEPATMLGATQKQWFKQRLKQSPARWKIWGNSLPALPLRLDLSSIPLQDLPDGILTNDAWAGFPGELRELMAFLESEKITGVVSLSGDHHMHGAGTLAVDPGADEVVPVALDFNVCGISSTPHLSNVMSSGDASDPAFSALVKAEFDGRVVPTWNLTLTQGVLASLAYSNTGWESLARWLGPNRANPGLAYVDSGAHGFGIARFRADSCEVELVTVAAADREYGDAGSPVQHRARLAVRHWRPGESPQLEGPQFDNKPGFIF
jgi:alkaline phosphatase D